MTGSGDPSDRDEQQDSREEPRPLAERTLGILLIVGLLCVVAGALLGLSDLTHTYRHDVSTTDVSSPDERIAYSALSPPATEAFQTARASDIPAWTANPAPEFGYPDQGTPSRATVQYQGETYRLSTQRQVRGVTALIGGVRLSLLAGGGLLILAGGWPFLSRRLLGRSLTSQESRATATLLPVWAFVLLVPSGVAGWMAVATLAETLGAGVNTFFLSIGIVGVPTSAAATVLFFEGFEAPARLFFSSALVGILGWVGLLLATLSPGIGDLVSAVFLFTFVVLYTVLGEIAGWNIWYRLLNASA